MMQIEGIEAKLFVNTCEVSHHIRVQVEIRQSDSWSDLDAAFFNHQKVMLRMTPDEWPSDVPLAWKEEWGSMMAVPCRIMSAHSVFDVGVVRAFELVNAGEPVTVEPKAVS